MIYSVVRMHCVLGGHHDLIFGSVDAAHARFDEYARQADADQAEYGAKVVKSSTSIQVTVPQSYRARLMPIDWRVELIESVATEDHR